MSEPDAGTALTDLRTRASIDGDTIVLDGTKRWCSGAGHSGGYVVFCRFDGIESAKGIGAVFVDLGTPGMSFGDQERMMGFRGGRSDGRRGGEEGFSLGRYRGGSYLL